MASVAASSTVLTISFSDKIVVFKRSSTQQIHEESVFPITAATKSETGTAVMDGYVPMVCSSLSPSGKYFAACTNKTLTLWNASTWTIVATAGLARAASCIAFSSSEDRIVISDKSGDAYLFGVEDLPTKPEPSLLLGHVSMLLRIAISRDDKYVLTCDRDEKIRVSHFPNAYSVQTYCIGHEDSVTCIDFPKNIPNLVISGGSDGTVRLWNYLTGTLLFTQDCSLAENSLIVDLVSFPVNTSAFIVCVILNKYNNLRVLSIDSVHTALQCTLLEDVLIPCCSPRSLVSHSDELFVLSFDAPNFITALKFVNKTFTLCTGLNESLKDATRKFTEDFSRIEHHLPEDRLLSYLNKRKLDDTQDYYKRKNERLLGILK